MQGREAFEDELESCSGFRLNQHVQLRRCLSISIPRNVVVAERVSVAARLPLNNTSARSWIVLPFRYAWGDANIGKALHSIGTPPGFRLGRPGVAWKLGGTHLVHRLRKCGRRLDDIRDSEVEEGSIEVVGWSG